MYWGQLLHRLQLEHNSVFHHQVEAVPTSQMYALVLNWKRYLPLELNVRSVSS